MGQHADLLITNADVFTATGHRHSIAIAGGQIIGFDANVAATRTVDLHGASVVIGLTDAHCHLYGLGLDLENVSVRGLDSEAAVVKVIADAAKTRPAPRAERGNEMATEWLVGRGWDQNRWPGTQFPTKASLDAAVNDRPVILRRIDGHAAWANSKALAAAKITKATPDPAGGKILRDGSGEPTGVFIDNAVDLVESAMPPATPEARERRILAAAKLAVEAGFTNLHEMGIEQETADVYRKLAADHRLPLRVHAYLLGNPAHSDALRTHGPEAGIDDTGRFEMKGVKFFIDGALGSRGARLYADYDDDKGNRGLWVTEPAVLTKAVDDAVAGGWQTAIHAIGDAGIGAVLDAYEAANAKHPGEHRLRIEHLQVLALKDLPRVVATHSIASMQPTHATSDMPWAEKRVGAERIKGAYAWRTMLDNKVPLAFGSDFPVEEVSPLLGIYAAVTRQDAKGQPPGGWYPAQRMTLDEAVAGFTSGAAYAAFGETEWNQRADLTIFDGPLTADHILDRKVSATIVGGEIVYGELH